MVSTISKVSKKGELICSSSDYTFSRCSQSYKRQRISSRSRNFIEALLSNNKESIKSTGNKLFLC